MSEEKVIIITRESIMQSIVSDIFSFVSLGGFFWFNYNFIGNSKFVNFLILLLIMCKAIGAMDSKNIKKYKGISEEKLQEIQNVLEKK